MNKSDVKIYINNKEKYYPKETVLTGLQIIEAAGKNPDNHTVQFKKNHGEGHSYRDFGKDEPIELKNNMSFKVIEDIDNGQKN